MPTIGAFHDKYWRAKAFTQPAVVPGRGGYPNWQASVLAVSVFGPPLDVLARALAYLRMILSAVWRWRSAPVEAWALPLQALSSEEWAIVARVFAALASPEMDTAATLVRGCSTMPRVDSEKTRIHYSRLLRTNKGQAQNVHRHLKVVSELKDAAPGLSNPEAHLLAELAYQGFAATGRPGRRIIAHPVLH